MSIFCCPVCREELFDDGHSLRCVHKHTFDFASSGYVSLLCGGKPGGEPGDNKEMCVSRNHFLSKGYYQCLARSVADCVANALAGVDSPLVVDAACGEGYYTAEIFRTLESAGLNPARSWVDLAKHALKYAAKRCKGVEFATASIFAMPLPDSCADVVTNLFAPVADAEFRRVLKPGGLMLVVGPGERHLWGLKEFLYAEPYRNEPKAYKFEGFTQYGHLHVESHIHLPCTRDILNLFSMTPYYWKTPAEAVQRLSLLQQLDTEISFEINLFRVMP